MHKRPSRPSDITKAVKRLLKIRPRSVGELQERLARKGFSLEVVEAVLTRLTQRNILNDRAFARWWIAQRTKIAPKGPFALRRELVQKKIAEDVIAEVLAESGIATMEDELAREVLGKRVARYRRFPPNVRRRRIAGVLSRRGFSSETISGILKGLK
jgi:regulatory protein